MYMPVDQPIQINKASNGWIVTLPIEYTKQPVLRRDPYMEFFSMKNIKKIAEMFKKIKNDEPVDDILEQDTFFTSPGYLDVETPQEQIYTHVFKTWDEASAFIKSKYDN